MNYDMRVFADQIQEIIFWDKIYYLNYLPISVEDFNKFRNTLNRVVKSYQINNKEIEQDRLYILSANWERVLNSYLDYWQERKSLKNIEIWQVIQQYLRLVYQSLKESEVEHEQ